jgi:hypothetical protein
MTMMSVIVILLAVKNYIIAVHITTLTSVSIPSLPHHQHHQFYPAAGRSKLNLPKELLLSVPFYIYEELDWLDETSITTIGNHTFREWLQLSVSERNFANKHDDDLKFYLAAVKHPMRVKRPEDAKLFIVPSLTTYIATDHIYKDSRVHLCRNYICGRDLLVHADDVLKNSTWFQKSNGSDHIVLITALLWQHHHLLEPWKFENMKKCNALQFGEGNKNWNHDDRLSFDTFYVGSGCSAVPFQDKTHDLAMIANLRFGSKSKRDIINFQDRRNICKWSNSSTFKSKHSMGVCGKGAQCPTLSKARLGFHVQGDTISANRLFDTILSGTVPIFTQKAQYTAHQSFIDWDVLSYFVPLGVNASDISFMQSLDVILGDMQGIEKKAQNVLDNRDLFDWDTLVPFDAYMYMIEAHLWPEMRVHSSKYSALILPAPLKDSIPKDVSALS